MKPAELQSPPLGLYVHLPWCVKKCPYCDFNSHEIRGSVPGNEYIDALLADLEQDVPRTWGRVVSSLFLGGGTPSLFTAGQIDSLLAGVRRLVPLAPGAEITLEANPGTVEHDSFDAYREAGINRVSLGVQSFDPPSLRAIGRIHGREEVDAALESLRSAGMANFNIDLMFGLPGQTMDQAITDVELAIEAGPMHISHYQLTLEPNTRFAAEPPALPDAETCWAMQEAAADRLRTAGFLDYEVSAWARDGQACAHNLNYWRYGDYLGIGAGAHAKLTDAAAGEVRRMVRHRHPRQFMAGVGYALDQSVAVEDRLFEFFLNGLRLREGISPADFESRTGVAWEAAEPGIGDALDRGLLEPCDGRFVKTSLGRRFVNDLQSIFLP